MNNQELLNKNGLDGLILSNPANIFYTTKSHINQLELEGFVLVTNEKNYIITDSRYALEVTNLTKEQSNLELVLISPNNHYVQTVINKVNELSLNKVGFEANNLTFNNYELFSKADFDLIPTTNIIENKRFVKTENELNILREAFDVTNALWKHVINFVEVGMMESDVVNEMHNFILANGGEGFSFDPIIASGINSAKPHAGWTNKVIQNNEIMTLDFGIKYKGYCTDITRNIAFGDIDPKLEEMFKITYQANVELENQIKAGMTCKQADAICRDYIKSKGYGDLFTHSTGHGIGLNVHEQPGLSYLSETVLQENNVVTIEPGLYDDNLGGCRVESSVIVTKDGCEILTSDIKELVRK